MLLYQLGPIIARCFYSVEGFFIYSLKQRASIKRDTNSEAGISKHMYVISGKDCFGYIFSRAEYRTKYRIQVDDRILKKLDDDYLFGDQLSGEQDELAERGASIKSRENTGCPLS